MDEADAEEDVQEDGERRGTTSRCLSGVVRTEVRKATETTEASSAMAVSCRDVIGGSRPQDISSPSGESHGKKLMERLQRITMLLWTNDPLTNSAWR